MDNHPGCCSVQDAVNDAVNDAEQVHQDVFNFKCKSHKELVDTISALVSMCNKDYDFSIVQAGTILSGLRNVLSCYVNEVSDFVGVYVTWKEVHGVFHILQHFADRSDTRSMVNKFCFDNRRLLVHPVVDNTCNNNYWMLMRCLRGCPDE